MFLEPKPFGFDGTLRCHHERRRRSEATTTLRARPGSQAAAASIQVLSDAHGVPPATALRPHAGPRRGGMAPNSGVGTAAVRPLQNGSLRFFLP